MMFKHGKKVSRYAAKQGKSGYTLSSGFCGTNCTIKSKHIFMYFSTPNSDASLALVRGFGNRKGTKNVVHLVRDSNT